VVEHGRASVPVTADEVAELQRAGVIPLAGETWGDSSPADQIVIVSAAMRLTEAPLDAKLDLRLPRPLLEDIRQLALVADRSMNAEVRIALRRHVEREAERREREEAA
jgi:Arc-like DNA binding domain